MQTKTPHIGPRRFGIMNSGELSHVSATTLTGIIFGRVLCPQTAPTQMHAMTTAIRPSTQRTTSMKADELMVGCRTRSIAVDRMLRIPLPARELSNLSVLSDSVEIIVEDRTNAPYRLTDFCYNIWNGTCFCGYVAHTLVVNGPSIDFFLVWSAWWMWRHLFIWVTYYSKRDVVQWESRAIFPLSKAHHQYILTIQWESSHYIGPFLSFFFKWWPKTTKYYSHVFLQFTKIWSYVNNYVGGHA